ncbi:glycosyltransferase family 4 protein [Treponema primitia]|uniref:glycosyltransferase family 4 protein n=1 Tax=Treponema primitia TaxID=88058 RepID=UPI0002554D65|nr:glycosyltransferase family 4 protein [Treponema primitia]
MKINIIYLYTEIQPYNIAIFHELLKRKNVAIHVFHWDKKILTPYIPPEIENVYYYKKSDFKTVNELFLTIKNLDPTIIYTSGWIDKDYMSVCRKTRKYLSIPVVSGSDTYWRGGKQWLNIIASPFWHRKCFSHIQVSGLWQFEYAHRLGFHAQNILMHNLSADTELFRKISIVQKERSYPKNILYIGRFSPEKGLKYLIEAWNAISDRKSWRLILIGNGPEKNVLIKNKNVEIKDYANQEVLTKYIQNAGCFVLPSIKEQWSLVLHEAATGGLPILASDICGAVPYFVINNYNGYTFKPGNVSEIQLAIEKIIDASEKRLVEMSYNSRKLSEKITPEIVANTFLSVLP